MRHDIGPGALFPDYELTDHTATRRGLSELQGQQPMVLVLSRGGYCPKDRRQAELLVQFHREMEVGYCRLVTICTDNIVRGAAAAISMRRVIALPEWPRFFPGSETNAHSCRSRTSQSRPAFHWGSRYSGNAEGHSTT